MADNARVYGTPQEVAMENAGDSARVSGVSQEVGMENPDTRLRVYGLSQETGMENPDTKMRVYFLAQEVAMGPTPIAAGDSVLQSRFMGRKTGVQGSGVGLQGVFISPDSIDD